MEDGQSPQQVWDTADPPFPVWPENFSFGPRARTGDQLNARPEVGVSRNIPFFMKRSSYVPNFANDTVTKADRVI